MTAAGEHPSTVEESKLIDNAVSRRSGDAAKIMAYAKNGMSRRTLAGTYGTELVDAVFAEMAREK